MRWGELRVAAVQHSVRRAGVAAFFDSFRNLRLLPAKQRYLVPPVGNAHRFGRMKIHNRTVRGYKFKPTMLAGLMAAGA